jgi:hypothetical protein
MPEELLENPAAVYRLPADEYAVRALRYSRGGGTDSYDEIGFRFAAAVPVMMKGAVSLQTLDSARLERSRRESRTRMSDPLTAIMDEEEKLRHRAIDLPQDSGRFSYRVIGRLLELTIESDDGHSELWTYPLTAPLPILRGSGSRSPTRRTCLSSTPGCGGCTDRGGSTPMEASWSPACIRSPWSTGQTSSRRRVTVVGSANRT